MTIPKQIRDRFGLGPDTVVEFAIDTNVLLDVPAPSEKFGDASVLALEDATSDGSLVICDLVYAELCVQLQPSKRIRSLSSRERDPREYRHQGGQRARILADFLIGAHAHMQASHLLTRDRGSIESCFLNSP